MGLTAIVGTAIDDDPLLTAYPALLSEDRHARAVAQAEAAGITGIRDLQAMSA